MSHTGIGFGSTILLASALMLAATGSAHGQNTPDTPTLILATTEGAGTRSRSKDGELIEPDPGHYVELARKAADLCGTSVEFRFMPWARVLKAVRAGTVSAGYASSYKAERAEYGAYPMLDGKPNEALAQRAYAYHLFARADDSAAIADWQSLIAGAVVSVERSSSIIPVLEDLGAEPYERTDYENQLELLLSKRSRFAVGIADNFEQEIEANPRFRDQVVRVEPPVQKRVGYVMFGKAFYEQHTELVDCYWQQAAEIAKTDWYQARKDYYAAKYE
ncbi:MAG: substrate-binding periplasmic protein [Rhodospirillaceae bacterium]